jgi:hypothetical protein
LAERNTFRVLYPLEAFDGGLNNKYEPNIIADNESPDCLNVVFDDRGGVQSRLGMKKFNTTTVGSFSGDGLFTYRQNDTTEIMVGWWNGTMYKLAGTTFTTVPSAQSVFTAGTRVDMLVYQNLAFFGNGGSTPYKYNGTEFTRHGIPQPNSSPTVISGTAGANLVPSGDVNYKVSYVNSYVAEGNVSTFTTTLNIATSASVSLTSLPLAPTSFGVVARKLYRKDSTTTGVYKLVTTVNDNTTTNYTDTTPGVSLSTSAPVDNAEPPNWSKGVVHQERLFLDDPTQPSKGAYSELANPFIVPIASNYLLFSDGDGENITAIGVHANNVAWQKDSSIWLTYMPSTDPTEWIRIKSLSKYGSASHYAQPDYSQLKMFIGKRYGVIAGFFAFAGVDTQPDATALPVTAIYSESKSDKIEPEVFGFARGAISKSCGIEFKNKLWFAVPTGVSTTNNKVYQFDFQRRDNDNTTGSWVPFSYPVSIAAFTIYAGKLYSQSGTANGFVYEMDAAQYGDDGSAINSYYWTKEFQGHPEHWESQKDFRFLYLTVETLGNWYMNISFRVDAYAGATVSQQVYLSPGSSVWGSAVWGAFTWGAGTTRKPIKVGLSPYAGKKIQFKFDNQNTLNQAFHVLPNGSFSYNVRGVR